jgi:hypothetical protein
MNNCRTEKHAPWIRECGVYITKHLKNFLSVFRLWKAQRHFISIQIPLGKRRAIVLFIRNVEDLIRWHPLLSAMNALIFIANPHSNENDLKYINK